MKFNFRKISAIASSILLAGMTMGVAAAAAYPNPFVVGGSADVAIVYGTGSGVNYLDLVQAGSIQANLQTYMGASTGTASTVTGEAAVLQSGSDRIYLSDQLGDGGVTQLTKDDLPTILADEIFDNGEDNDYSQRIEIGADTYATFTFSDSGADLVDPELIINLGRSTSNPIYNLIADFDAATDINGTDSIGENIVLFGKEYIIGSKTDGDEIQLLAGTLDITLNWGDTQTVTFEGESYEVTLDGIKDATPDEATVTVNGASATIAEGKTKKVAGVQVYADTVNYYGMESNPGMAIISLGANEIWLKHGDEVGIGSSKEGVDGTLVTLTPNDPNVDNSKLTQIKISVTADDSENDHLSIGDSFKDPVFGTIKLTFADLINGPDLSEGAVDSNINRKSIEVLRDSAAALQVKMTDSNGNTATLPFAYNKTDDIVLADKDGKVIAVVEGTNIDVDESYLILNSGGEYVAMGQVKTTNNDDRTKLDLTIKDLFTNDNIVDWDDKDLTDPQTFTYKGKTFTVTCTTAENGDTTIADTVTEKINVYPFIEIYSGYNHRVAFIEDTAEAVTDATGTDGQGDTPVKVTLPTGELWLDSYQTTTAHDTAAYSIDGGDNWVVLTSTEAKSMPVGTVDYVVTWTTGAGAFDIGIEVDQDTPTNVAQVNAGLLIVEDEDAAHGDVKEAIIIGTDDTGTADKKLEVQQLLFSSTELSEAFDADGLTGYIDKFGSYALMDTNGDQNLVEITMPKNQMYVEVYMSEEAASITAGVAAVTGGATQIGDILVKDTEVSSVSTKNLIVIGGSCINSAAATLVGGPYCGADWTTATGVGSGQFLLKGYTNPSIAPTKMALLVAGYEAADTVNAATYARTQAFDTSKEYLGTSATSATLVTTETTE